MAHDIIHTPVKKALIKDGWTITADPLTIEYKDEYLYVDLAAERTIAAERDGDQIAVEIKSFAGASGMKDFQQAIGQYTVYRSVLSKTAPHYKLYLAIGIDTYRRTFNRSMVRLVLQDSHISLIIIDLEKEEIVEWIS